MIRVFLPPPSEGDSAPKTSRKEGCVSLPILGKPADLWWARSTAKDLEAWGTDNWKSLSTKYYLLLINFKDMRNPITVYANSQNDYYVQDQVEEEGTKTPVTNYAPIIDLLPGDVYVADIMTRSKRVH